MILKSLVVSKCFLDKPVYLWIKHMFYDIFILNIPYYILYIALLIFTYLNYGIKTRSTFPLNPKSN